MSRLCFNCKQEPEVFQTSEGEDAYWIIVDNEDRDPAVLMSDLNWNFKVTTDKEPDLRDNETAFCVRCCGFEDEEDENVSDESN